MTDEDPDPMYSAGRSGNRPRRGPQRNPVRAPQPWDRPHSQQTLSSNSHIHQNGARYLAQYGPNDISGFTPPMQEHFTKLMEMVAQQTACPPRAEYAIPSYHPQPSCYPKENGVEDNDKAEEDADNDGEDEEVGEGEEAEDQDQDRDQEEEEEEEEWSDADDEDTRMTDLPTGMAKLSLNEKLRPAFSHVKSDPKLRPTGSGNYPQPLATPPMEPQQSRSTQDIPSQLKQPFVMTAPSDNPSHYLPPSTLMHHPQSGPPFTSFMQSQSNRKHDQFSDMSAFHLGGATINTRPTFNVINGVYEKVDRTSHIVNVGSGNVNNTLIKDSNNDNSIQNFASQGVCQV
ncbi:hypothetical protein CVT25_003312 [Psilocybe cyanescens]|uniref:Uncharacterized protein n=1 Tax=Psilocybe cyanescens TaxID=93625 RepID=A0A409WMQ7_PSICY|nr:hypothetical protein CVT25_003312 [Psilocybe cyanescens]